MARDRVGVNGQGRIPGPLGTIPTDCRRPLRAAVGVGISNCVSTHVDTTHRQIPFWVVSVTLKAREMLQTFQRIHGGGVRMKIYIGDTRVNELYEW